MYLFEDLKYFIRFMLILRRLKPFSQTNIHIFLFAFVSISLKAAFKYTSVKKVHFGENLTVKCKMWDKIQNF